ncbi:Alanine racemase [Alkalibacterium sp. AK22]|uniref:alanine racemase n=1 Tax=Alkalibacterium sp. AK22 TaxID=1229520 RepID=UPI00044F7BC4|nr:alanine racemase [Alkalibacterium sp. AK22]EXJ23619.1 Alanine racemase [Alkalibacterium sp. AK22]
MSYGSYRYTKAEVDLDKITFNFKSMQNHISAGTQLMAVIKADAYGHGAVEVARHLEKQGVDYLAVAVMDEAIELRSAGITCPILLLSPIEPDTIPTAVRWDITLTIFSERIAAAVQAFARITKKTVKVHVKVDTGMGRIGARTEEETLRLCQLLNADNIFCEGIFTHFAEAENTADPSFTKKQFKAFIGTVDYLQDKGFNFSLRHCSNTAAAMLYPEFDLDMIRTGISLFGYHPDPALKQLLDLKPALTLTTHAAMIKSVPAGQTIGYGRTYKTEKEETIATLLLGYADGIPRELSNRWYLTSKKHKASIVGRICMDQLMVNVTDIPDFSYEDELVFIGDPDKGHPSIYTMADLTDSFHYEILCGIGKRIPRVYTKGEAVKAKQNVLLDR